MLFCSILCVLLISSVDGRSDDVCFSLNRGSDDIGGTEGVRTLQGVSGKRGPKGSIGQMGPPGPPGQCACNPGEIEELREQIRQFQGSYCSIGMRDRRVKDEDITASSSWNFEHGPYAARLDNRRSVTGNAPDRGSWSARHNKIGEWIQVDLHQPTRLTGVITQGRPYSTDQWVTSFKISYGNSTDQLQVMLDNNGNELTFTGNVDMDSYSNNKFPRPVVARYVRLLPQAWHGHISLRMEYLTC